MSPSLLEDLFLDGDGYIVGYDEPVTDTSSAMREHRATLVEAIFRLRSRLSSRGNIAITSILDDRH